MDPSTALTLDMTLASNKAMPGRKKTSDMASGAGALAAINGDFNIDPGRPLHNYAEDGTLKQTGFQNGGSFAISKDETHEYANSSNVNIDGQNTSNGKSFNIVDWNHGSPSLGAIDAYTKYGGSVETPPANSCAVRLKRASALHWQAGENGVYRDYVAKTLKCQSGALTFKRMPLILASKESGVGADTLRTLTPGTPVRVSWRYATPGTGIGAGPWTGVMDAVGGMPVLVDNGLAYQKANCSSYFCDRNPRTGIGYEADGTIVMVTVDGREPGVSVGMTLNAFADYMQSLGCTYALNLDGGGSTTMWVKGDGVVNHPSDSTGERWVTNAVVVLPAADTGEPTPLVHASYIGPAPTDSGTIEARDPGSTGGLLDFVAGNGAQLTPDLAAIARAFSASNR
jgi:hypothetical protein